MKKNQFPFPKSESCPLGDLPAHIKTWGGSDCSPDSIECATNLDTGGFFHVFPHNCCAKCKTRFTGWKSKCFLDILFFKFDLPFFS